MEVFDFPSGDSGVNDDDNAGGVQACGWLGWLCQGFASRHRDWLFWAGMTEGGLYMVLWGDGGWGRVTEVGEGVSTHKTGRPPEYCIESSAYAPLSASACN